MFRWIGRGLRVGKLTTRYPWARPEVEALGSSIAAIHPQGPERAGTEAAEAICPTGAIAVDDEGVTLDLGRCVACGLCWAASPGSFVAGPAYGSAADRREGLLVRCAWNARPEPPARRARELSGPWRRSLHVRHIDAGSDGAIELELAQLVAPHYDLHRLGVFFTASPRHADALLVTGPVTDGMVPALRATFEAMPSPKLVVAAGADAISGGLWAGGENVVGDIDEVLPVDVYIPGSPPSPLALIDGLLLASGRRFRLLTAATEAAGLAP